MGPFLGITGKLKTLIDRLTSGRAENLDNLDAAISSRAAAANALSSLTWTSARAGYLDRLNQFLDAGTGIMLPKFQLITSGTSWTRPANIIDNLVWISAIAGGESYNSAPLAGQGGSYINRTPYTVGASVSYSLGAGGTGTSGANGGNTTWDSSAIVLVGGGGTGCTGARPASQNSYFNAESTSGHYGSGAPYSGTTGGGAGLVFSGTMYGQGGSGSSNNGGNGAIFLEWWEYA